MSEFYVGYLPMPQRLRRFTAGLVVCLAALLVGLALVFAAGQDDPGSGRWEEEPRSFEGVLVAKPYPGIILTEGEPEYILLVAAGKHGTASLIADIALHRARVRGTVLRRGEMRLAEVVDEPDAIVDLGPTPSQSPANRVVGQTVSLRGEIIDPKCYFGAMKPGSGKTHKACAALCLRGGIPPMFVAATNPNQIFLLLDSRGRAFDPEQLERLIDFVGEDVQVPAYVGYLAGLPTLSIDPSRIRRVNR